MERPQCPIDIGEPLSLCKDIQGHGEPTGEDMVLATLCAHDEMQEALVGGMDSKMKVENLEVKGDKPVPQI